MPLEVGKNILFRICWIMAITAECFWLHWTLQGYKMRTKNQSGLSSSGEIRNGLPDYKWNRWVSPLWTSVLVWHLKCYLLRIKEAENLKISCYLWANFTSEIILFMAISNENQCLPSLAQNNKRTFKKKKILKLYITFIVHN